MKKSQFILLVALSIGFVTSSFAQHKNYDIKNGFGLSGGLTNYNIVSDNFELTKGNGWIAGMSAMVMLPHKGFGVSYGMQLSENTFGIMGKTSPTDPSLQELEYKIFTAQLLFLWHIKLAKDFVTLDVGPVLQYNSDMELKDDAQEIFYINNYDAVQATDISEISNINFNAAIGLSAGFSHFRLKAQYMYGLTNIFNKLNKVEIDQGADPVKFKGNQSMLALTAMITF